MRARGGTVAAALAALAACGPGDAAVPATVATVAPAGASNPTVARAPDGEATLVAWVGRDGGEANVHLARAEGSGGFSAPVRVNDLPGDAAPHEQAPAQVAAGPDGAVYVLWQNNTEIPGRRFPASDLRLARSTDGGRTFAPAVTVNDDAGGPPSSHTFHDLLVGADGAVYVSWIDSRVRDAARAAAAPVEGAAAAGGDGGHHGGMGEEGLPGSEIRVARSTDGGRTFGPSVVVDGGACPCCRTSLAAGRDGSLYLAWRKEYPGDVRDVVVARAAPGAALRFGAPVRVHDDGWAIPACPHAGPSLAVDASGRVHVGWYTGREGRQGLWYAASADGGESWGEPAAVLVDAWVPPSQVRLAASGDDVWLAWDDRRTEDRRVRFARLEDGRPVALEGEGPAGQLPALAAGPSGWSAAWLEGGAVRALR